MSHSRPALGLLGLIPGCRVQGYGVGVGASHSSCPFSLALRSGSGLRSCFPHSETAQHFVFISLGSGGSQGEGKVNADASLFSIVGGVIGVFGIYRTSLEEVEYA